MTSGYSPPAANLGVLLNCVILMKSFSVLLSAMVVSTLAGAQSSSPPKLAASVELAIVNCRIELGDGKSIGSGFVVIKGGKIAQVGEGAAPSGISTLDATGKVLYPGFIDAFSTTGAKTPTPATTSEFDRPSASASAPATMWIGNRRGITGEFKAADNLDVSASDTRLSNAVTTAVLGHTLGIIRGTFCVTDLLPAAASERVVNANAAFGLGYRGGGVGGGGGAGYPSNILGVIALLRQTLYDAKAIADGVPLSTAAKKPAWMTSLEGMQPLLKKQAPAMIEANSERELDRTFRVFDEFGFETILFGAREAFKRTDDIAARKFAVVVTADLGLEPALKGDDDGPDATPSEVRAERNQRWQEQSHGAEILAKKGIPIAFSSEGGTSDFLKNVRNLVKRGLSKDVALTALTSGAAKIFHIDDQVGSIAVGKRANIVLMSAEFDKDDAVVEKVWVDGRPSFEKKEVKK